MWIVCGYHTEDKSYTQHAEKLKESLVSLNISFDIIPIQEQGDWYKNTQYKPVFLKHMLEKHYPNSVVYVDVDAIFCQYPNFFDRLDRESDVNMAVHVLDHSKYRRKTAAPELLSGTIFLKNTKVTKQIVNDWVHECKKDPKLWDQRALAVVLRKYKYHLLPEEYCMIFDYMSSVKNPVIKHFQASRESRRKANIKKKRSISTPRRVVKNGTVRIKRIN